MSTEREARPGAKATGITNKPDARERAEQERLPPRGARKGEAPPPEVVEAEGEANTTAPTRGLGARARTHSATGRESTQGARSGAPPAASEEAVLPAEVRAFIEELRAERATLLDQLEKRSGLAHSLSEDLSEPEDDAGLGAAQRDTDRLEPMLERAARRIDAIQRVLERAVQGRLTLCDRCGQSIGIERLRALPETALCVACARELERRSDA